MQSLPYLEWSAIKPSCLSAGAQTDGPPGPIVQIDNEGWLLPSHGSIVSDGRPGIAPVRPAGQVGNK